MTADLFALALYQALLWYDFSGRGGDFNLAHTARGFAYAWQRKGHDVRTAPIYPTLREYWAANGISNA